jgi:hypothetical protein
MTMAPPSTYSHIFLYIKKYSNIYDERLDRIDNVAHIESSILLQYCTTRKLSELIIQ